MKKAWDDKAYEDRADELFSTAFDEMLEGFEEFPHSAFIMLMLKALESTYAVMRKLDVDILDIEDVLEEGCYFSIRRLKQVYDDEPVKETIADLDRRRSPRHALDHVLF
jgi:hypothetical protein